MADKETTPASGGGAGTQTEELAQAYRKAIAGGFAAADAGIAQTAAAVRTLTGAVQTERNEYGKAVEQAVGQARARGENLAAAMQSMAAPPAPGATPFGPEAKEAVNKLIEGETAFQQAWTKGWMDYLSGAEARRSAAAQAMLEGNATVVERSQEAMQSAVEYGAALMDWSMESAKGMKSWRS